MLDWVLREMSGDGGGGYLIERRSRCWSVVLC